MRIYLFLLAVGMFARETTFRATVPVVLVPVTVTDARGKLVDGMGVADFAVSDNGRAVRFQLDTSDTIHVPVALIVAVQTNDLSAAALMKIRKAGAMIQPLITGERGTAAVLAVDERVTVAQEFTLDPAALTRAFQQGKSCRGVRYCRGWACIAASPRGAPSSSAGREPGIWDLTAR